jgi:hypothetical protein
MLDELEEQIQMAGSLGKVSHAPLSAFAVGDVSFVGAESVIACYCCAAIHLYREVQSAGTCMMLTGCGYM